MFPIKSTAEILAFKVLNRDINEVWVDWAVDMLMTGFDTEHLVILAGISPPYDQFELNTLTEKVLSELNLEYQDSNQIIKTYVSYLIEKANSSKDNILPVLRDLKDLCVELDYEKDIYQFYKLYFAKLDLLDSNNQWYWDGANKDNIDVIIEDTFTNWLLENPI